MARFTVDFPDEVNEILDRLAKEESTSKREVIRKALALYNYLHQEGVKTGSDKRLSIRGTDDQVVKDILF